jgi:hypothetical protein
VANTVSNAARTICTDVVIKRSRRRAIRSASAPPMSPANALGTNAAAATIPAQPACPVCSVTRMPTATVSIHVPMFDTNAPNQNRA